MKYFYVGQRPKLEVLDEWMGNLNLQMDQIAFMGDDVNDLEIMNAVGLAVCPADAVDQIKAISDIVLDRKGGDAAVREFVDRFILSV